MILFGIMFVIFIYVMTNYYIANRILKVLSIRFKNINLMIYTSIFVVLIFSVVLMFVPVRGIEIFFDEIFSFWLGMYLYFLVLFSLADIILLILKLFRKISDEFKKKFQNIIYSVVICIVCCVMVGGFINSCQVNDTEYNVVLESKNLENDIKLVLISDLHIGSPFSEMRLSKVVEKINTKKPDIVCISGDFFDNNADLIKDPENVKTLFKSIKAKYGVYAVLGNHDSGSTFDKMVELIEESDIKLLNDEFVNIDDKFILVGRLDISPVIEFGNDLKRSNVDSVFKNIDNNLPIIVMDHNPISCEEYKNKADLVLSGHTHKGQFFPFNLVTKNKYLIDYGYLKLDSTHIVVSSGAGLWKIPLRICSNNEVVTINISSKK